MAKRVMRSNKRTQRRRGSQLKQRKKRSKLLKRTLKRRNSFRKKNTYKRRKTNMKGGGGSRAFRETFADSFNNGEYMNDLTRLSKDLTVLLNDTEELRRGG